MNRTDTVKLSGQLELSQAEATATHIASTDDEISHLGWPIAGGAGLPQLSPTVCVYQHMPLFLQSEPLAEIETAGRTAVRRSSNRL